jgi:hypothetical protein
MGNREDANVCGGYITFTVNVAKVTETDKPTFNWTTSSWGKIIGGQGTSTITVDSGPSFGYELTVAVEIEGVPALSTLADKRASRTIRINECFCPHIWTSGPTDVLSPGTPAAVSVNILGGDPNWNLKYNWKSSAGKIVNGQGTPAITIDTTGTNSDDASATVEVEGFPPECDKSASYKFSVILCGLVRADKVNEYDDLSRKIEGSHLDNFAIQLLQMANSKGYIIIYGPRRVDQRLAHVRNYLVVKRGMDPNRFTVVNGGHNKKVRTELWVVPPGADPPKPDPNF